MHDHPDLYGVLGVEPSATFVEIRAVYRQRAQALHTDCLDRTGTLEARAHASETLRELGEAYRTLRNPNLRREYDLGRVNRPSLVPNPTRKRPTAIRQTKRRTRLTPERRRSLGRMAIVLGFGLLVLWAVLANMFERRDAEAFFRSQPPAGATARQIR